MSVASTSSTMDVWDNSVPDTAPAAHVAKARAPAAVVRDSWDDDDDDDDEEDVAEEETPQSLWENANKKAPMPELVSSGSGTSVALPPPPAAFQPALKILKRPTTGPASPSTSAPSSADVQKSYAEREAKYQAARQRIFKDTARPSATSDATSDVEARTPPPVDTASVKVIRAPRGPPADAPITSADSKSSRGFASKRGGRGAPTPRA
ncbi:hypothetical protein FOMPIDRAFT_1039093 [Fomitopsis schrenkii]|uniref:SUZ domain-containing protein n=1 Tax=Fomitopsis schrenkii TaxID=2126942 RepID=S8DIL9_FOMSC|nr:hypothetical protein FOMPIDRAFT_1039093 [Fomitopsis schrenkii]